MNNRFIVGSDSRGLSTFIDKAEDEERLSNLCRVLHENPENSVRILSDWLALGNNLTGDSLTKIFDRLASQKHYKAAMKILRYAREQKVAELTPENCIREISMICRQHAPGVAERVFCSLPPSLRTPEVTNSFIISLTKQKAVGKAEKWFHLIPEVSSELLDAMISAYFSRDMHDKALALCDAFRSSGLPPPLRTYLTLLRCRDRGVLPENLGIDLERDARAAAAGVDLGSNSEVMHLNHLMELYGYLGDSNGVGDIWERLIMRDDILQDSFFRGILAFGLVGEVEKSESILKNLMMQGNRLRPFSNPYYVLMEVYARLGMMERAEEVLEKKIERRVFHPYNPLIWGYLARNETRKALERLDEGYRLREQGEIVPDYRVVVGLLPVFAAAQDVVSAERLMRFYRGRGDVRIYNEMLKVYVSAQRAPNFGLLYHPGIQPLVSTSG